jgi:hypothetical protein
MPKLYKNDPIAPTRPVGVSVRQDEDGAGIDLVLVYLDTGAEVQGGFLLGITEHGKLMRYGYINAEGAAAAGIVIDAEGRIQTTEE